MSTIARVIEITVCSAIYAFVGLMLGITSGYMVTRLIEWLTGASLLFSAIGQITVALWAFLLAGLAVFAYLRSPDR